MTARCPLCGGEVDPDRTMVDRVTSCVSRDGVMVHLETQEMNVFWILHDQYPALVSHDRIYDHLYRGTDRYPDTRVVNVLISRLRSKLKRLGLGIETVGRHGWKLVEMEPAWVGRVLKVCTA